jgi:hypothetical protein
LARDVDFPTPLTPMKTIEYTCPFYFALKASLRISIFFFGVKSFVIDSTRAFLTVALILVKLSVFLSTNVALTD